MGAFKEAPVADLPPTDRPRRTDREREREREREKKREH